MTSDYLVRRVSCEYPIDGRFQKAQTEAAAERFRTEYEGFSIAKIRVNASKLDGSDWSVTISGESWTYLGEDTA